MPRKWERYNGQLPTGPSFDPEEEKKKLQAELQAAKDENERLLAFQKSQEIQQVQQETQDKLTQLKDALEQGEKTAQDVVEQIGDVGEADQEKIDKLEAIAIQIIETLENLENMPDYATYVPEDYQVTTDEYKQALHDPKSRPQTQLKIKQALSHMASFVAESAGGLNLFQDSFAFLNKSLIIIQEAHIDMKEGLETAQAFDQKK